MHIQQAELMWYFIPDPIISVMLESFLLIIYLLILVGHQIQYYVIKYVSDL
jgi:hypothetical protein